MVHLPVSQHLFAVEFSILRKDTINSNPLDDEIPTVSALLFAAAEEKDENCIMYAPVFHTTESRPQPLLHPGIL